MEAVSLTLVNGATFYAGEVMKGNNFLTYLLIKLIYLDFFVYILKELFTFILAATQKSKVREKYKFTDYFRKL